MTMIEERVDRLEAVLEEFMAQTTRAITRQDASITRLERIIAETNARSEREARELRRQLGEISMRLGTIVEDIIAPSLRRMAEAEFDCGKIESFSLRVEKYHPGTNQRREFDVMVVGTKAILLNDTKANARPEYAKEFVEFLQRGEFFEYFPEYRGQPLIPVFSSLYIPEEVVTDLTRHDIYAVAMGEETMQVLNLDEVRAHS